MGQAVYSIGIDLGTTNCALAYAPLEEGASRSSILSISQWDSPSSLSDRDTLPSFLYRPNEEQSAALRGKTKGNEWIAGEWARRQTTDHPDRVVQSAKSWLCTSGVDLDSSFLPWGSETLDEADKISPVRASALLLDYLRNAWNGHFPEAPFDDQDVTITVPASFDASAQGLTLRAAWEAGFPEGTRLLEEPQAAFYRWLEANESESPLVECLPDLPRRPHCILVVDVGGGTSDFSLFRVSTKKNCQAPPGIERIAVSDHILLGGDNIDLAMAHVVAEIQLNASLAPDQWGHLIARCRQIKEEALADPGREEPFKLAIPGRGSGLMSSTLSAELSPEDVRLILFEGFYPECARDEIPEQSAAGLREFGLPYARDHAVTRHLAEFLRGRPPIDAILFNGGSLKPEAIQNRITSVIENWQGRAPTVLGNPESELAVARGAASYGWMRQHHARRIESGAPRSLFLEVVGQDREDLVCILPKGTPREDTVILDQLEFALQANQPVSFQLLSSTRLDSVEAGDILDAEQRSQHFHRLPPLATIARHEGADRIPVQLSARLNNIGLLQLQCIARDDPDQHWPLEFNLKGESHPRALTADDVTEEKTAASPTVSESDLEKARNRLESLFEAELDPREKLTANRVTSSLEKILGLPKQQWDAVLLRKLWDTHADCFGSCYHSVEHEEAWLTFAGFILRPGYGVQFDEERVDWLWKAEETGYDFPGKRLDLARFVLWRRVAGGLSREHQEILAEECLAKIQGQKKPSAESVRLIGTLERLGLEKKSEITSVLLDRGLALAGSGGYSDPYWVSLMLLLNRSPIHAGPETVLPPEEVEKAFQLIRKLNWKDAGLASIIPLFLRASRRVDNPSLDLPKKLRNDILTQLRRADVPPPRLQPIKEFVPIRQDDQVSLMGDPLPPGLILQRRE